MIEGGSTRRAITDHAGRLDLWAPQFDGHDVDKAHELIRVLRADIRPRQRLGLVGGDLLGSI